MKRWKFKKERGFTLIEIIVVLIILAIMAVGLGNVIVFAVQNFIFAREANQLSQKAQLALARINRELVELKSVSSASANDVQYTLSTGETYRILFTGNQITLERINPAIAAQILIGGLATNNGGSNFLIYSKTSGSAWTTADSINELAQIQVTIVLDFQQTNQLTFQTTVNPRRTNIPNAPRLN